MACVFLDQKPEAGIGGGSPFFHLHALTAPEVVPTGVSQVEVGLDAGDVAG